MWQRWKQRKQLAPKASIVFQRSAASLCSVHSSSNKPSVSALRLTSVAQRQQNAMQGRIGLCAALFSLVFVGLGARLGAISLLGEGEPSVVEGAQIAKISPRADVLDRNGIALALSRATIGLSIKSKNVWDTDELLVGLENALPGVDIIRLAEQLQRRKTVVVKNELSADEHKRVLMLGLPGLEFPKSYKRVYPQGQIASHIIGYTRLGAGGVIGVEKFLNESDDEALNGQLRISIDLAVQQVLEEELLSAFDQFKAKAAWGIMLDAHSGEVIALANLPDFNPNAPALASSGAWRNRAMQDQFELGSAFKAITAAAALEDDVATPEGVYDARKPIRVADRTITDFHPKNKILNFSEVIQYSSNIGMAQVAAQLGTDRQKAYFSQLGLTKALITELPETRTPLLPQRWGPIETATISYGHGIAVSPLQLTAAFAATINDGSFRIPTFIAEKAQTGAPVFSMNTVANMRLILRRVITDGTARRAEAPGYYVIGKTATADKVSKTGGYEKDARLSSFIGAFPGYDPKYVMLVSFDEPVPEELISSYATAGIVAAPAFAKIVERAAPLLGVHPVTDDIAFAKFMAPFQQNAAIKVTALHSGNAPMEMGLLRGEAQP